MRLIIRLNIKNTIKLLQYYLKKIVAINIINENMFAHINVYYSLIKEGAKIV